MKSETFINDGFLIILSGADSEERSCAGVGYIIAPWCRRRVKTYRQVSDRLAYLKVEVAGGVAGIITAYTPHNLKPLAERFSFYVDLDHVYRECTANQGRLILGDFNGHARLGEQDTIGPYTFGLEAVHQVEVPNRDLLLEFCIGAELVIMSTFIDRPCYEKFTFVEAGARFSGDVSESTHSTLRGI